MKMTLNRAFRHAQMLSDVLDRPLLLMKKEDDFALLRIERLKRRVKQDLHMLSTLVVGGERIGTRLVTLPCADCVGVVRGTMLLKMVDKEAPRDREQPRREAEPVVEAVEVAKHSNERFLHHVLRDIGTTRQPEHEREERILMTADESLDRDAVAALGLPNE